MSSAPKYIPHYTVADYRQWEGDWELWSGIPVAMTPSPFGPHQAVAARLIRHLGNQLDAAQCGCEVLHEIDWVISDDTIVRPDVLVVCGRVPERHVCEAPALIAEVVSSSTESKDRGVKRALYQQHGIRYYLLLDPHDRTVEVHRQTESGIYETFAPDSPFEIALAGTCKIILDPTKLFG